MATILGSINDFLTTFFIILLLLVFFYGQNFQGWHASTQLKRALRKLEKSMEYGNNLIKKSIAPFQSESQTAHDVEYFIKEMIEFFVLAPEKSEHLTLSNLNELNVRREKRYLELIQKFLPRIEEQSLQQIVALLNTTTEINRLYKKVRHNLIVGEKTKSYWFLLQSASEISQTMLTAKAYRIALDSFMDNIPIGDSIGPLVVRKFARDNSLDPNTSLTSETKTQIENDNYIKQSIHYRDRFCICLRAKGPEPRVGNPGMIIESVINKISSQDKKIAMLITIDAISRLEGEFPGTVAQGLGVAIGSMQKEKTDKIQIEHILNSQNPAIQMEAIVCRESLEEAFLPMIDPIKAAVPKILRILKQIIRSQTEPGDTVVIFGVGNALGIPL